MTTDETSDRSSESDSDDESANPGNGDGHAHDAGDGHAHDGGDGHSHDHSGDSHSSDHGGDYPTEEESGSYLYPNEPDTGGGHEHSHGHSHGPSFDDPAPDDWWGRWKRVLLEWYHGLTHAMFEAHAFENIEKEAEDIEDAFLFACFADAFGIPSPISYYTVELLPFLTEEFEQWERRMWDRDTLLERKGEQYHFH